MENKLEDKKNPVQSAERIFLVMETLAETGEIGLMELSTKLGLHKSTVHRLLMSLIYMGYARQDEETGKYTVTYNYEVEIKAEECSAPLHKDGKHYVHKVCTVHEFDEQGNCIKNCIVDEHNTIGHDAEGNLCRVESHYVDGEHQDSCGHEKYEGKCISYTCNK